jgi:AcrR family transcriptional regulator
MPYRRTENVLRRLTARKDAIVAAACAVANEGGMAAIQIASIAQRADIAAGTVYRYFPGKTDLLGALIASISEREVAAVRRAADVAPGPLSALAASIATFAARALRNRRLTYALIAEPVDADVDAVRLIFRKSITDEFATRIKTAIAGGHLPEQDFSLAAPALVGALLEGLIGPIPPRRTRRCRCSRCWHCARSACLTRTRAASWCKRFCRQMKMPRRDCARPAHSIIWNADDYFEPSALNCFKYAQRLAMSFSFLMPTNAILVFGIFAAGLTIYSLKLASFQVMPEFLLASL